MSVSVLVAIVAAAMNISGAAHAQAGRWEVIRQSGGGSVARVEFQGLATGVAFRCLGNAPVIALNFARTPARNPARVTLTVDGSPLQMGLIYNANSRAWVGRVADRRVIDTMIGGSTAQITVEGVSYGAAPLAGSREAVSTALTACYRPPAQTAAATPAAPAALAGAVEDGQQCPALTGLDRWAKANVKNYQGDYNVFCGDFIGDGGRDAFAVILSPFVGGNAMMQEAVLFQNVGGQLRFLRKVPEFFGDTRRAAFAPGKITLDMTVMRPGDPRCCPSGTERREVDVATGRHALAATARPASPPAATPAAATRPAGPQSVTVNVQLSPRAAALATRRTARLWVWWGGDPLPARVAAARTANLLEEDGTLALGFAEKQVPLQNGPVTLAPASYESRYAGWVRQVTIKGGLDPNNLTSITCAPVKGVPLTISCKAVGER